MHHAPSTLDCRDGRGALHRAEARYDEL
jgi:hypothetical protein